MNTYILKAHSLKKAIFNYPDLPVLFLCHSDIWFDSDFGMWPAHTISTRIGKVLSIPPDSDLSDYEQIFTDEDKDNLEDNIRDYFSNVSDEIFASDEEFEKRVEEELKKYDAHWKDCIIVQLGP